MAKKIFKKPDSFYKTFFRKPGKDKKTTHYCPGCGHGIVHKLIAEALSDFKINKKTLFISPVGCSVFAYYYFDCGNIQVAHGRAPAVGTGLSRANPDSYIISYQGDGDLAAIGTAEIIHAANRGENIAVFFVNNTIYGMTGGQMAPTTLVDQKTTTTPYGRTVNNEGYPIKMAEIISQLESPVYVARTALSTTKKIFETRKAIRKSLNIQIEKKGFAFVEIISPCPVGMKISPEKADEWIEKKVLPYFKTGVFKDKSDKTPVKLSSKPIFNKNKIKKILNLSSGKKIRTRTESKKIDTLEIKIAGFGGQGILLLGALIAEAGMLHNYNTTWLPSYGPEMRGGTANCSVIIKSGNIGSPTVYNPDILIAMNQPSVDKFLKRMKKNGILFYNSSIIKNKINSSYTKCAVPALDIASKYENPRTANIAMLGTFIKKTGFLNKNEVLNLFNKYFKNEALANINKKVFEEGYNL